MPATATNNVLEYYLAVNDGGWWVEGEPEYPRLTLTPFDPARFPPGRNSDGVTFAFRYADSHGMPWLLVPENNRAKQTVALLNASVLKSRLDDVETERYDYGNRGLDSGYELGEQSIIVADPDLIDDVLWERSAVGFVRSRMLVTDVRKAWNLLEDLVAKYESGDIAGAPTYEFGNYW